MSSNARLLLKCIERVRLPSIHHGDYTIIAELATPEIGAAGTSGEQRSTGRSRGPAVIVLWNGTLVVLAEKEFHHEGTKFPMKSPGLVLVVRFLRGLRGFVVKSALPRTPMPSQPRYQEANHPITLMGGGFLAFVPDLPGCMPDGATYEQAAHTIVGAIEN